MGIKRKLFVTVLLAIAAMPLSAQSTVAHEIVKGNTIYSLAREYGSTVEAINEANPNSPTAISRRLRRIIRGSLV